LTAKMNSSLTLPGLMITEFCTDLTFSQNYALFLVHLNSVLTLLFNCFILHMQVSTVLLKN